MKIAFKTFGCKANSVDTDALYLEAVRRGYSVVPEDQAADAYIINSCTVTANADRDARWQVNKFKRLNPTAAVAVIGCYAQVAKQELLSIADVDYVIGTAEKMSVLDHLVKHHEGERAARDQVQPATGFLPEIFRGSRNARATVKVQDGCNFKCSFCIIPEARGRSRSLPIETVLRQLDEAEALGFNEVTLTGIHLAHYGWDRNSNLMALVEAILARPTSPRIRLSTLDPFEIPDELIELVAAEERICPHYHIALQSGSDAVLKGMRRIYRAQEFVDVTNKIGRRDANTFIGVDVIVGFPGEGEAEFEESVKCLKDSYWTKLHVFPFSVRKGTRAETLPDKVAGPVAIERSRRLRELSDETYRTFLQTQLGKERNVLLERPFPKIPRAWIGHTENYLPALVLMNDALPRQMVRATLRSIEGEKVWATPLSLP
jgi:threonylcarbamoyladenosine tRNA methylthiotransferase MtaB